MRLRTSSLVALTLTALPVARAVDLDAGLKQAINQVLYRLAPAGPGAYRAINPAQHLSVDFSANGARLQHPKGSATLHLLGYGYGEHLRTAAQVPPASSRGRVEYRRADLTEWYKNEAGGLEQGFTLSKRPGDPGQADRLVIALGVDGELSPELTPQGDAVLLGQVMRYAGLRSWDARGRTLPSRLEVRAHAIRIAIDDRDAEYPLVVDPTWVQQQALTETAGVGSSDNFGYSVSVDGDTAVIGAPGTTFNPAPNPTQGAAFVFVRSGSPPVWTLQQELTAADGAQGDFFGTSVSVGGDTVVVGAPYRNGKQGAAYVFIRSGSPPVWALQQELTASDGMANDYFGYSVSVSGNTVAVGAPPNLGAASGSLTGCSGGTTAPDGIVYAFVRGATMPPWTQQQELTVAGATGLGLSVAVSGNTILAGAGGYYCQLRPLEQFHFNEAAYVFVSSATTPPWTLQQKLTGLAGLIFGQSVALSGDTAVIGAPYEFGSVPGAAYVYVRGATTPPWTQQQQLTPSDGNQFGRPVALSGNTAVIGGISQQGEEAAYVFVGIGGVWAQVQKLTNSNGPRNDEFAISLAVSGNTVLAGDPAQGAAYVFIASGPQGPIVGPVTPNSGSGLGPQTFTAVYADPNGASDLQTIYLSFVTAPGTSPGPNSCTAVYVPSSNSLFLYNDAGVSPVPGSLTPGGPGTLSNSQCTLSGAGGAVTPSGTSLTVPFAITFAPGFKGLQNIYGFAQSVGAGSSDWQLRGTWTSAPPPTVVSVAPNNGSGSGPQIFTATYTDANGASDLQEVYLDIATSPGAASSCNVAYVQATNSLYLFDNTNSTMLGPIHIGTTDSAANSQCTLTGAGGAVTSSGTTLTLPFSISFPQPAFAGAKNVYGRAQIYSGYSTSWQLLGTWTVTAPPPPPSAVSVTPSSGSGFGPQTFTAVYTDPKGASDLQAVYLDIATATSGTVPSCWVAYVAGTNSLYLVNNTTPITPGSNMTVSNSQCTLSGVGGTVTSSGNNLTVPFSITFAQSGFAGAKNIYGLAQSYGASGGAFVLLGTWTVPTAGPPPPPPTAVSVTPSSGSGPSQTFTATYTDPNGASDLQVVYLEIGSRGGNAYSCFIAYLPSTHSLYLYNDTNSAVLGPITAGTSAMASNNSCTVSGSGGAATSTGNNLTLPVAITFAASFNGSKNVLGAAQSYSGAGSGWQLLGTWTPAAAGTLTAVSVSPVNSSGFGPLTFSALYTDTSGASDIQVAYLDFGPSVFAANSCIVAYVRGSDTLYLFNDDPTMPALGPISAGSANTLSNSQCTLSGSGGLAMAAGNNLTAPFAITFLGTFTGSKNVYGMVQAYSGGVQSPWANFGTWTP